MSGCRVIRGATGEESGSHLQEQLPGSAVLSCEYKHLHLRRSWLLSANIVDSALFAVTLVTFGIGLHHQRKEELSQRGAPAGGIFSPNAVHQKEQDAIATEPKPEPAVV
jgi:hypothetical protein